MNTHRTHHAGVLAPAHRRSRERGHGGIEKRVGGAAALDRAVEDRIAGEEHAREVYRLGAAQETLRHLLAIDEERSDDDLAERVRDIRGFRTPRASGTGRRTY
jgi:hypothetical protein